VEALIHKRLTSGGFDTVEDVLRHALRVQDEEESFLQEDREVIAAQVENGYLQAERRELIDGDQVRLDMQAMKENWRQSRR
jgi:hypothetical protein